jgi:hypothetical protein
VSPQSSLLLMRRLMKRIHKLRIQKRLQLPSVTKRIRPRIRMRRKPSRRILLPVMKRTEPLLVRKQQLKLPRPLLLPTILLLRPRTVEANMIRPSLLLSSSVSMILRMGKQPQRRRRSRRRRRTKLHLQRVPSM